MIGILILTVLGFVLSLILVNIDTLIKKENKQQTFLELLPGYNCGACGYAGCKGMSEAMMEDVMNYKKCKPLRGEKLQEMEAYLRKIKEK